VKSCFSVRDWNVGDIIPLGGGNLRIADLATRRDWAMHQPTS
jgi:hypothetical protein